MVLTGEGSDEHFGGYNWFLSDRLREDDLTLPDTLSTSERTSKLEGMQGGGGGAGNNSRPKQTTASGVPAFNQSGNTASSTVQRMLNNLGSASIVTAPFERSMYAD